MTFSRATTYITCRSCGTNLGRVEPKPGRRREYCNASCRKAAARAREADPEGWEADQKARARRQRNRERKIEREERETQEWLDGIRIGAQRMAALSEAEYQAKLRAVEAEPESARDERLFDDPKVRKLLALAVASENEEEALVAFEAARRAYRRVTNGS